MKRVKVTEFKTKRINKLTGGVIGTFKIPNYPNDQGVLENSFLTKDGSYIGDYDRGWWYVKNKLKVCEEYPAGSAECYEDNNLIGYIGYTHRGASKFKIGDRLFDENYKPVKEDYDKEQWNKWNKEFEKKYNEEDDFDRECIYADISAIIPFNMRGKIIKDIHEARKAAINLSKYLS